MKLPPAFGNQEIVPSLHFSLNPGTEPDPERLKQERQKWHNGVRIHQQPVAIGRFAVETGVLSEATSALGNLPYKRLCDYYDRESESFPSIADRQTLGRPALAMVYSTGRLLLHAVALDMQRAGLSQEEYKGLAVLVEGGCLEEEDGREEYGRWSWHVDGSSDPELTFRYVTTLIGDTTHFAPGSLRKGEHHTLADDYSSAERPDFLPGTILRFDMHTVHRTPPTLGPRLFATASSSLVVRT